MEQYGAVYFLIEKEEPTVLLANIFLTIEAVKQMLFSKGDVKKIEEVQKEINILEKFRHPHIVHYCGHRMETTSTSVEFFIFMELYEQPCSLKGAIQKRLNCLTSANYGLI